MSSRQSRAGRGAEPAEQPPGLVEETKMKKLLAAIAGAAALVIPVTANAAGNLASAPTDLQITIDSRAPSFSQTEFDIETGKYYRLTITHDGLEEMQWMSPELFRNSWVNQIVVNDLEIKPLAVYSVEFDDAGDIVIFFVPVRTGDFDFYVVGMEERGLKGTFHVR
jgi:hypothetical protein